MFLSAVWWLTVFSELAGSVSKLSCSTGPLSDLRFKAIWFGRRENLTIFIGKNFSNIFITDISINAIRSFSIDFIDIFQLSQLWFGIEHSTSYYLNHWILGPLLLTNITSSGHSQLNMYQLSRTAEGWKKCDVSNSSTAYTCLDQCGSVLTG